MWWTATAVYMTMATFDPSAPSSWLRYCLLSLSTFLGYHPFSQVKSLHSSELHSVYSGVGHQMPETWAVETPTKVLSVSIKLSMTLSLIISTLCMGECIGCANPANHDNLGTSYWQLLHHVNKSTNKHKSLPYRNFIQAMISVTIWQSPTVFLAVLGSLSRHQSLSPASHLGCCLADSLKMHLSLFVCIKSSTPPQLYLDSAGHARRVIYGNQPR